MRSSRLCTEWSVRVSLSSVHSALGMRRAWPAREVGDRRDPTTWRAAPRAEWQPFRVGGGGARRKGQRTGRAQQIPAGRTGVRLVRVLAVWEMGDRGF